MMIQFDRYDTCHRLTSDSVKGKLQLANKHVNGLYLHLLSRSALAAE